MATFKILSGKSLANALTGHGAKIASYKERDHQLAASALNHLEQHNDACHLNTLFNITPANYRAALVSWANKFGKCKFNPENKSFEYSKGKKSDFESALAIAPADYVKESKKDGKEAKAKTAIEILDALITKADESAIDCDSQLLSDLEAALSRAKYRAMKAQKEANEQAIQRQLEKDTKDAKIEKAVKADLKAKKTVKPSNVTPIKAETVKETAKPEMVAA